VWSITSHLHYLAIEARVVLVGDHYVHHVGGVIEMVRSTVKPPIRLVRDICTWKIGEVL